MRANAWLTRSVTVSRQPGSSVVATDMAMDIASRDERGRPLQYNDTTNRALGAIIGRTPPTSPRYSITPSSRELRCNGGRFVVQRERGRLYCGRKRKPEPSASHKPLRVSSFPFLNPSSLIMCEFRLMQKAQQVALLVGAEDVNGTVVRRVVSGNDKSDAAGAMKFYVRGTDIGLIAAQQREHDSWGRVHWEKQLSADDMYG